MELKEMRVYQDLEVISKGMEGYKEYEDLKAYIERALQVACCEQYLKDIYKYVNKKRIVVSQEYKKKTFGIGNARRRGGRYNSWYIEEE